MHVASAPNHIQLESSQKPEAHRRWSLWDSNQHGLVFRYDSCTLDIRRQLNQAIQNGKEFVGAAHRAMSSLDDKILLNYFFKDHEHSIVNTVLKNLQDRLNGVGPTVELWCADSSKGSDDAWKCDMGMLAFTDLYEDKDETWGRIGFCPAAFLSHALPDPCDKSALRLNNENRGTSVVMWLLHEMIHLPYIGVLDVWHIGDTGFNKPLLCHALKEATSDSLNISQVQPATNVKNHVWFIQWAWVSEQQQKTCVANWPLWNILTSPEGQKRLEHEELRNVLAAGDNDVTDSAADEKISPGDALQDVFLVPKP